MKEIISNLAADCQLCCDESRCYWRWLPHPRFCCM